MACLNRECFQQKWKARPWRRLLSQPKCASYRAIFHCSSYPTLFRVIPYRRSRYCLRCSQILKARSVGTKVTLNTAPVFYNQCWPIKWILDKCLSFQLCPALDWLLSILLITRGIWGVRSLYSGLNNVATASGARESLIHELFPNPYVPASSVSASDKGDKAWPRHHHFCNSSSQLSKLSVAVFLIGNFNAIKAWGGGAAAGPAYSVSSRDSRLTVAWELDWGRALPQWHCWSIARGMDGNIVPSDLSPTTCATEPLTKRLYHGTLFESCVSVNSHKEWTGNAQGMTSLIEINRPASNWRCLSGLGLPRQRPEQRL